LERGWGEALYCTNNKTIYEKECNLSVVNRLIDFYLLIINPLNQHYKKMTISINRLINFVPERDDKRNG